MPTNYAEELDPVILVLCSLDKKLVFSGSSFNETRSFLNGIWGREPRGKWRKMTYGCGEVDGWCGGEAVWLGCGWRRCGFRLENSGNGCRNSSSIRTNDGEKWRGKLPDEQAGREREKEDSSLVLAVNQVGKKKKGPTGLPDSHSAISLIRHIPWRNSFN